LASFETLERDETNGAEVEQRPVLNASEEKQDVNPTVGEECMEVQKEEVLVGEKRAHPRVQWDIPVDLHLNKIKPVTAVIKNLSLSGAYAVCNDLSIFKLGDQCRLNLSLSDKDPNLAINSQVEVVRLKPSRGLGLKFLDLDSTSLNYLRQVVG